MSSDLQPLENTQHRYAPYEILRARARIQLNIRWLLFVNTQRGDFSFFAQVISFEHMNYSSSPRDIQGGLDEEIAKLLLQYLELLGFHDRSISNDQERFDKYKVGR